MQIKIYDKDRFEVRPEEIDIGYIEIITEVGTFGINIEFLKRP